ncbi:enhanced intracellular survival protein Eis [Umezawaea endophytica]|uniref:GNAT family N-acetyltransferase n=1 Tax=Umezawaea endophytica TaxID=1654476 RepID=A0A9X2VM05_9PSEU|nr:GNAT family N-acetyltransferase [Umezawaea endophytica]MCS7479091.1 GNAT family N-acetyltransferase [Umezawaea endophytica]
MDIREYTEDDRDTVLRMRKLAFASAQPPPEKLVTPGRLGLLAHDGGEPLGSLLINDFAQFFGGRAVPTGGIGGVVVDPHARGRGVASALLDTALRTMREQGQSLSALYPTVPSLYRGRGWERSGVLERLVFPMDRLLMSPRAPHRLATRRATRADLADVHACYTDLAATVDGLLDRHAPTFQPEKLLDLDVATLVHDADGVLRGYLTADRERDGLKVHDLVAADLDAQLTLLAELTSWSGVLDTVDVRVVDPAFTGLLTAQAMRIEMSVSLWFLRVVDLPAAVAARGWPAAAGLKAGAVDLDVVDEHAPWHAGRQRLVVDDGGVRVEPGGSGAVQVHARALGPWFSGAQGTAALRRAGLLSGEAPLLDQLVAAPGNPRLADFF